MDQIFSSKYWNEELAWNSNSLLFSSSFLKIALTWGPSIFFWVLLLAGTCFFIKIQKIRLSWTALDVTSSRKNPENQASFLSKITFWWLNRIVVFGYKKSLTNADLWELSQENRCEYLQECFNKYWLPLVKEVKSMLIGFMGSNEPYWRGFLYAGGMLFASVLETFLNGQYEYRSFITAMKIRSCIISIIYEKALTLSTTARKNFTVGEVVNLMAVDTHRIRDYAHKVTLLVSTPLGIGIAIYLLWQQLGIAALGGVTVLILVLPLNGILSYYIRNCQVFIMKDKDCRIKLMNEILSGIKVLKLYAWEKSFIEEVRKIRHREVGNLETQAYRYTAMNFTLTCIPYLVSLASFATYVLIDSSHVLNASRAFVSLSLFNIIRRPTEILPRVITLTSLCAVSVKRINRYLQSDEIDPSMIEHDPSGNNSVVIKNGTFSWNKEEDPTLKDINLSVKEGSLVAVVGPVGAGKSSILSALLGEMVKLSGQIKMKGSVAYVPQQAWIQNTTLQNNVLFNQSHEFAHYNKVLCACALLPDLEMLPGGDQTEIGEKGINLSGGQKQRVSLARAVYNNSDVYFLDDPLSAVDVHVGKHIFENVIGPQGLLKEKTRILVTHRISILPEVDKIIVLQNGKVSETGSYKELLAKKGAFSDFLVEYLQKHIVEDADILPPEELNLMQSIAATVGAPNLARQISERSEKGCNLENSIEMSKMSPIECKDSGDMLRRRRSTSKDQKTPFVAKKLGAKSKLIEKEVVEVGLVKSSIYIDYIKAFGVWNFFLTLACYALQIFFSLSYSLWLSAWSNDALYPANAENKQDERLNVYGVLGAGEIAFTIIGAILLNLGCIRASKILHDRMLCQIMKAPMSFFDTTPLGRILNNLSKEIDATDVTIQFYIRIFMLTAVRAVSAIIVISLQMPFFILVCVPLAAIYYFMQKFYIPTSRQLKRLESTTRSPIYSHFSETIQGASCIRAFRAQNSFVARSNQLVDINNEPYYISIGATRWLCLRLELVGCFVLFITALFAVLTRNTLSPGIVGLFVSYALQITAILNRLIRAIAGVETTIVSVERCLEYTKTPTEAVWENENNKPEASWPKDGCIQFDNYSTRYREGLDLVLKGITCSIKSNERVGIVGRTGAGKSSLTLALFRIIESAGGKILIDGVEIQKLGLHDLRSRLTIIPQDPVLFTGSLRMNLDPFGKYSDNALWLALKQAHLIKFVQSLEQGLGHAISEGGENLSVGQRQLVCLARALLRKSKILVLDEATAAVDVETDEVIQSTIRSEFGDCTILTIAHRLNTIMDYDKVIVMDKGLIKEIGKPENLLRDEKSVFYAMAKDAGLL